ncbi:MAG: SMP-30/gluconolactonase/LRE family protein [Gemmataceae bacterium]|nr:SMP-30/gluconolactonase/LRE family protein [Gemmataceae bacterium]
MQPCLLLCLLAAEPALAERLSAIKPTRYAEAPGYSEGPTWRDGEVFFCSGALLRVDRDRKVTKHLAINPAGTYLKADGGILICDMKTPGILEYAKDGKVGVLADSYKGKKFGGPNDLTVDADGCVWFTDPHSSSRENPVGKVYRVSPEGEVSLMADDLAFPNGLEVDEGNRWLYVIESQTAKVLRYAMPKKGERLGRAEVFYSLGGSGGDGCAFDAAGNLWVADFSRPDTKQGRVTVLTPEGKAIGHLKVPAGQVSNVSFGGKDRDELFISTGSPPGVFHAKVGVKGWAGHPGKKMEWLRTLDVKPMDEPLKGK